MNPLHSGMKQYILPAVLLITLIVSLSNCSKGGGGDNGGCSEPAIVATTTPANGTTENPAPGPNFPLTVNITSGFPSGGATLEVKVHPDGNSTNFFTTSVNATNGTNNITITSTPINVTCVVEVTVTSKTCNTNKFTSTYRYSRK